MSIQAKAAVNDVIQIDPAQEDSFFRGCLAIVTEVNSWGVLCFVAMPGERGEMPGQAYARIRWDEFEVIGQASWAPAREDT